MAVGETTPHHPDRRPHFNSLTGLRVIGMVLVFVVHGSFEIPFTSYRLGLAYLTDVGTTGQTAVTYFFVLSGFVLTWSWGRNDTARTFWRRRAVRVFPNHVTALVLALVLIAVFLPMPGVLPVITQLFLVQSWVPSPAFTDIGNSVTWSLAVDVAFYAIFPLLLPLIRRIRPERLWYAAGVVAVAIALIPLAADHFLPATPATPLWNTSESRYWLVYFCPVSRMLECVLGMLVARVVMTGRWIGLRPLPAAGILAVVYALVQQLPYLYRFTAFTPVPVALLTASLAAADLAGRRTGLTGRTMVRLGELTFAFYLIHGSVLKYGHLMLGYTMDGGAPKGKSWDTAGGLAFLAGTFLVSLALAWLLNVCVERPALRRWARRRAPVAPPVPVTA